MEILTFVIALATIAQAIIYGFQAKMMRDGLAATQEALKVAKISADSAGGTLEQLRLEQRAWLSITAAITNLQVGAPIGVDFIMENSGKTPAIIRKVKIGHSIQADYRLVDYSQVVAAHTSDRPWQSRENTVAPNGTYNVPLEDGHTLTQKELNSLDMANDGVLYFVVTVQYSDFAGGRESQVLLTYTLESKRFEQWERYNYMK